MSHFIDSNFDLFIHLIEEIRFSTSTFKLALELLNNEDNDRWSLIVRHAKQLGLKYV